MNRAIAKRPYFEARSDKRYFLAQIAKEVRAGRLEVHAYCLMTTHFHLLVRSPLGELSDAMRRAQNAYSRYFNRRRGRDGPLIRARFLSKRIESVQYRSTVVRYIDANPVRAGLVATASEHEFGSARAFVVGPRPPWLRVDWVAQRALELTGSHAFDGATYERAFGIHDPDAAEAVVELVEARMDSASEVDALDDLVGRTPDQVRSWLAGNARLADGMPIGMPVCGPTSVSRALARHLASEGDWVVAHGGQTWRASEVAHVGLLRDLGSLSLGRIGDVLGLGARATSRRAALHRDLLRSDRPYQERIGTIARAAIAESA